MEGAIRELRNVVYRDEAIDDRTEYGNRFMMIPYWAEPALEASWEWVKKVGLFLWNWLMFFLNGIKSGAMGFWNWITRTWKIIRENPRYFVVSLLMVLGSAFLVGVLIKQMQEDERIRLAKKAHDWKRMLNPVLTDEHRKDYERKQALQSSEP
jgi:hypothetical protein